ncbi:hypothetical protein DW838_15410 [Dorea formicigenerans]|nr:hypothetical protein DW838_15410 [Dorea formicigenerans]
MFEAVFLYNRKLHFLLYKKPPAGCALARIRIMPQASPYSLRSLLDERHWRSATRSARECAKAYSLFYPDKSLRTFSLLTSGQSAGDMQTADRKNLNKEKETKL